MSAQKGRKSSKGKDQNSSPKLSLQSQSLWRSGQLQERSLALLEQLNRTGRRLAFSVAERRTVSMLYRYLKSEKCNINWQVSAASTPLWPATFLFSCWSLLLSLVGWFDVWWGVSLSLLLGVAVYWEWSGTFRVSQLFFAPRGSHILTLEGEESDAKHTLLLCVGVDTPTRDPVYETDAQRTLRLLHLQSLTPATLLLICIVALPILLTLRWWIPHPLIEWLYAGHTTSLSLACFFFYFSGRKSGNHRPHNAAVATAVEVMERLKQIDLPMRVKLVLLGASSQGVGMESWIRQNSANYPNQETYMLSIAPLDAAGDTLYYRTHEGILQRHPMHPKWIEAAEQTAMKFARETGWGPIPSPQRRFGSSLTETAHRFGYPALTLGATTSTVRTTEPMTAEESTSMIDKTAGWCVAVIQALAKHSIDPKNPASPPA